MYMAVWRLFAEKHPDWSETKLKRTVNRFTAPIHGKVPPPHSTGGAVDVVLGNEEKLPLDVTSPYKRDDPHGFLTAAQGLSEEAAKNRTLLCRTMHEAGLTNYPSEYWHYSYGDQGWAYRGGHPHAVYGPTAPKGWLPPEEELTDEPLEWADVP
jgi:D-alanyl-D-alanine dipeptidase